MDWVAPAIMTLVVVLGMAIGLAFGYRLRRRRKDMLHCFLLPSIIAILWTPCFYGARWIGHRAQVADTRDRVRSGPVIILDDHDGILTVGFPPPGGGRPTPEPVTFDLRFKGFADLSASDLAAGALLAGLLSALASVGGRWLGRRRATSVAR